MKEFFDFLWTVSPIVTMLFIVVWLLVIIVTKVNRFYSRFTGLEKEVPALRADMDRRFEQVDKRFEQVDRRFDQMDQRFEQIDKRFEQVDRRFEHMEKRFDRIEDKIDKLTDYLIDGKSEVHRKAS